MVDCNSLQQLIATIDCNGWFFPGFAHKGVQHITINLIWFLNNQMLHSNVITWPTVALWYVRTRGQMLHSNVSLPIPRVDVISIAFSPEIDSPCLQVPGQFWEPRTLQMITEPKTPSHYRKCVRKWPNYNNIKAIKWSFQGHQGSLGVIKGSLGPLKMNCVEEMIDINLDYPILTVWAFFNYLWVIIWPPPRKSFTRNSEK